MIYEPSELMNRLRICIIDTDDDLDYMARFYEITTQEYTDDDDRDDLPEWSYVF